MMKKKQFGLLHFYLQSQTDKKKKKKRKKEQKRKRNPNSPSLKKKEKSAVRLEHCHERNAACFIKMQ